VNSTNTTGDSGRGEATTAPDPDNGPNSGYAYSVTGRRLLIRADGGAGIGLGHLTRCLALAQAWRDRGGAVVLASGNVPSGSAERWRAEGAEITEPGTMEGRFDWIVLDGPHLRAPEQAVPGGRVLMIDDDGRRSGYACQLLLNQNLGAEAALYAGKTDATLLLGPRHALLRRPFRPTERTNVAGKSERTVPVRARTLLITFGGSDPGGFTERAIEALALMREPIAATILIGGGNPRAEAIRRLADARENVTLVIDSPDPSDLMRAADLALSAGGSTLWELAALGVPMVIGSAVPVEALPVEAMAKAGAALSLGALSGVGPEVMAGTLDRLIGDAATREALSHKARALIDGAGADRVIDAMIAYDSKG
jgi:spore coat polysaccharide biosynthesis predicted glycosyltransferase SpsG